jgi:long-subunit acyl-CoA synthetase (AMP-forming)
VRIADDGEVLVRGGVVFAGYWNNPTATQAAVDGDWLRTGDTGELDDDGYLTITGRKKDIIVTAGGKNVAPAYFEDRLRGHWLIDQCVLVGDRRPYVGALLTLDPHGFAHWNAPTAGRRRPPWSSCATTPICSPRCRPPSTRSTTPCPGPRRSNASGSSPVRSRSATN